MSNREDAKRALDRSVKGRDDRSTSNPDHRLADAMAGIGYALMALLDDIDEARSRDDDDTP